MHDTPRNPIQFVLAELVHFWRRGHACAYQHLPTARLLSRDRLRVCEVVLLLEGSQCLSVSLIIRACERGAVMARNGVHLRTRPTYHSTGLTRSITGCVGAAQHSAIIHNSIAFPKTEWIW